MYVLSSRYSR